MKRSLHRLANTIHGNTLFKTISRTRLYREACERYGLVYFGSVDSHNDGDAIVRGLTVSLGHKDRHYCMGNINGFDVILLERTDQLFFPYKKPESYRWTILQIDLDKTTLPHIYIDAHNYDSGFYSALFTKYPRLKNLEHAVSNDHDPKFNKSFTVYGSYADLSLIKNALPSHITAMLAHHFTHYDFEMHDDKLLVYNSHTQPGRHHIDHIVRVGIWLANEIEKTNK